MIIHASYILDMDDFCGRLNPYYLILFNTYAQIIQSMANQAAQPARNSSSLGFAAQIAAQPARKSSSLGFAAQIAAQPARKSSSLGFAAQIAAQPARKSSSLGFAAQIAAQLMGDDLTPIQVDLNPEYLLVNR